MTGCATCHGEGELAQLIPESNGAPVLLAPCSKVATRFRELLAMDPMRRSLLIVHASSESHRLIGPLLTAWARRALAEGLRRVPCECRRYTITVAGEPVRDEAPA